MDTTSVEWPIQSKMQVNLAEEKKTRQSDEESELSGCLTGWTDCLRQTVHTGLEEEPAPQSHHGETRHQTLDYGRERGRDRRTERQEDRERQGETGADLETRWQGLLRWARDKDHPREG